MWRLKNKIRGFAKKMYHKLNPQYKYILHMTDAIDRIEQRLNEQKLNIPSNYQASNSELKKLYLAEDYINYRYLYLARYIRENDRVLDIEGGYGTGIDLLSRYTAVDECICVNSISYYTKIGAMYYQSDFVKFRTGCFERIDEKFNIVTFFDEEMTEFLDEQNIKKLGELVEYNGILAVAFKKNFTEKEALIEKLKAIGFQIETRLYQNQNIPELLETEIGDMNEVIYLRKNA